MKNQIKQWLLGLIFLLIGNIACAQVGPCPPGMSQYPSPNGVPSCGPLQNQPQGYNQPQGHWVTQWGAFAQGDDGIAGLSSNQPSEEAAKWAALDNCRRRGGKQCTEKNTYYNSCIAIVGGTDPSGQGRGTTSIARTYKDAIKNALKECKSSDQTDCELFRAECSQAQWVSD